MSSSHPFSEEPSAPRRDAKLIATIGIAVAFVWAIYHPADSTAIEQGYALGFTLAVMMLVTGIAWAYRIVPTWQWKYASWWVDASVLSMAGWVFFAAWASSGGFLSGGFTSTLPEMGLPEVGGDLRSATNEAWWWIAAAGLFVVLRRVLFDLDRVVSMFGLLLAAGAMLAVHTLHQYAISLPQTLQDFLAAPDEMLAQIGMEAEAGSASRMIFENRLRDGGPTATFALANSLAGPLAMTVVLAGGCWIGWMQTARTRSADRAMPMLIGIAAGGLGIGLLLTALWATGSRSGLLSVVLMTGIMIAKSVWNRATQDRSSTGKSTAKSTARSTAKSTRRSTRLTWISTGVGGVVLIGAVGRFGAQLTGGEWVSQAPATIQLRMQYWSSTWAMVLDRPWFGAGPGNFQLVYQTYRDVRAHELIAEPHNFFFETLASGGVVAGLLLIAALVTGMFSYRDSSRRVHDHSNEEANRLPRPDARTGVVVGCAALAGILSVWYAGIASGDLPDFDAHLLAVPMFFAVFGGWCWAINRGVLAITPAQCRSIAAMVTCTGLLHLCFSGGWTVPGVAFFLICFAAIATPVPPSAPERRGSNRFAGQVTVVSIGIALVLFVYVFSFRPVRATRAALAQSAMLISTNRVGSAEQILKSNLIADPLDRDTAIWLASSENRTWMPLAVANSPGAVRQRKLADEAMRDAIRRSGNDPVRLRAIAEQWIHAYQVAAGVSNLVNANVTLALARKLSPTHESITAQQAEVLREIERLGIRPEPDSSTETSSMEMSAVELATRAEMLASAGGVVTRSLGLQRILRARVIGRDALTGPVRFNADELLQPGAIPVRK